MERPNNDDINEMFNNRELFNYSNILQEFNTNVIPNKNEIKNFFNDPDYKDDNYRLYERTIFDKTMIQLTDFFSLKKNFDSNRFYKYDTKKILKTITSGDCYPQNEQLQIRYYGDSNYPNIPFGGSQFFYK